MHDVFLCSGQCGNFQGTFDRTAKQSMVSRVDCHLPVGPKCLYHLMLLPSLLPGTVSVQLWGRGDQFMFSPLSLQSACDLFPWPVVGSGLLSLSADSGGDTEPNVE